MSYMFDWAENFNHSINKWNVSKVTNFEHIFRMCPIKDEYKPKKFRRYFL